MEILKRLLFFVFQYSEGICGITIIIKRKQIHTVLSGSQILLLSIGPGGTPFYGLYGGCAAAQGI